MYFYQPSLVPSYKYPSSIDWGNWWSWDQADSYDTSRAYDYVHVTVSTNVYVTVHLAETSFSLQAAYWALYRVARNYPALVKTHTWQWYINQAVLTVNRMTQNNVGYTNDGLMDETVIRVLLDDLKREGLSGNASLVESKMRARASVWAGEQFPQVFTSEYVEHVVLLAYYLDSAPRWHGILLGKKASTRGPNISTTVRRLRMSSTLSLHTSQPSLIGVTMATQGVIGASLCKDQMFVSCNRFHHFSGTTSMAGNCSVLSDRSTTMEVASMHFP